MTTAPQTISAQKAHDLVKEGNAIIIDVREPSEFANEHIACATSMPLATVGPNLFSVFPATANIIFQCQRGARGGQACALINPSDRNVYNLAGGFDAWKSARLPIVSAVPGRPIQQQVQIAVGVAVLSSILGGFLVHPALFIVAAFFGAGLTFAGLSGWCGLAPLMKRAPWNVKPKPTS